KRASFTLVKEAEIKIVPVCIHGAYLIAHKKSWHITPGRVHLTIGDPISVDTVVRSTKEELMSMTHNAIVAMQEAV
ncbi:hypothetical protein ACFL6D_02235, partial [Spirochaetota bacterium]